MSNKIACFKIQKAFGIVLSIASVIATANNLWYFMDNGNSIADFLTNITNIILLVGLVFFILSAVIDNVWLRYVQVGILYLHSLLVFSFDTGFVSAWGLLSIVCLLCHAYGFLHRFRQAKLVCLCAGCLVVVISIGIVRGNLVRSLSGVVNGSLYFGLLAYLFVTIPRGEGGESEENDKAIATDVTMPHDRAETLRTWLEKNQSEVHFTEKEMDVLCLFVESGGRFSNKEIAGQLGYSLPTVKMVFHQLLHKFGVQSRTELLKRLLDLV